MTGHTLVGTTLRERTAEATTNVRLRGALARATGRFGEHRLAALDTLEDPDGLRQRRTGDQGRRDRATCPSCSSSSPTT